MTLTESVGRRFVITGNLYTVERAIPENQWVLAVDSDGGVRVFNWIDFEQQAKPLEAK